MKTSIYQGLKIFLTVFLSFWCMIKINDFIAPDTTINRFGVNSYLVASETDSMIPTLKPFDLVFVKKINNFKRLTCSRKPHHLTNQPFNPQVEKGDIIVFKNNFNQHYTIHRLIKNDVLNQMITTLGDNNPTIYGFEMEIDYQDVLGVYWFHLSGWWLMLSALMICLAYGLKLVRYRYQSRNGIKK